MYVCVYIYIYVYPFSFTVGYSHFFKLLMTCWISHLTWSRTLHLLSSAPEDSFEQITSWATSTRDIKLSQCFIVFSPPFSSPAPVRISWIRFLDPASMKAEPWAAEIGSESTRSAGFFSPQKRLEWENPSFSCVQNLEVHHPTFSSLPRDVSDEDISSPSIKSPKQNPGLWNRTSTCAVLLRTPRM